ncbi:MAG: enoyl-CoA hydratase/carnithine racemase, partial [Bacteroidia bacterium]
MVKLMTDTVLYSREGHVARLVLNNPQRHNALGAEQLAAIRACLEKLSVDTQARVLIVTGVGDKTFCAGASLQELGAGEVTANAFQGMTAALAAVPLPTICALNGNVFGGGVELALACDFRIGIEGSRLQVPAAAIGLCYPLEGIRRFLEVLGPQQARRILVAAEAFEADAMLGIGFLDRLVARHELESEVEAFAAHIATLAPLAVQSMKQILRQASTDQVDIDRARDLAVRCLESADLQEGLAAKQEKRP